MLYEASPGWGQGDIGEAILTEHVLPSTSYQARLTKYLVVPSRSYQEPPGET